MADSPIFQAPAGRPAPGRNPLHRPVSPSDNAAVIHTHTPAAQTHSVPFGEGSIVLVTLNHPREKYWGAIIAISPAGVSLRGMDLNSFEDFSRQVLAGEPVAPHMVFFPMHRVERMEVDVRNGEIPSLSERFEGRTSRTCADLFSGNFEASPSRD